MILIIIHSIKFELVNIIGTLTACQSLAKSC